MNLDTTNLLVTGGGGFIGSALVEMLLARPGVRVLNLDKVTYAANPEALKRFAREPNYGFARGDICDRPLVERLLAEFRPQGLIHLAAESHVDRSIDDAAGFLQTNIMGTHALLEASLAYWRGLAGSEKEAFRFLHVSTDEVYGSLGPRGLFREDSPYLPNSPYSASKASSDLLVRAWQRTYGLPTITCHASNNYGPRQFPEKLIPLMIIKAQNGEALPVYGKGDNVRDWMHVSDHARGLLMAMERGQIGQTYNLGGGVELNNLELVQRICRMLDQELAGSRRGPHEELITFVPDRPGHDQRYALDIGKARAELGWSPQVEFDQGLADTVRWYLDNRAWWERIQKERYDGVRLGLA
ncbi:dTDP-glucose 4,6-dehydratase [Desulfoferula mesophila]|uniref:dTDP-glucose 4,6-dehydratase n=1 Tax=Desulfoferula mesophila TaxID=3058419 RepID=A0AAU9F152_9BACT|nr:dTDP-glucose 4,6-dehydratase [Desulfoferula mesophilus]